MKRTELTDDTTGHVISISLGEYPDGRIRSIVADGTHWVTVSSANMQENIGARKAQQRLLDNLVEAIAALDSPTKVELEESGAVVAVPVDRLVWRSAVLTAIEEARLTI